MICVLCNRRITGCQLKETCYKNTDLRLFVEQKMPTGDVSLTLLLTLITNTAAGALLDLCLWLIIDYNVYLPHDRAANLISVYDV